MVLCTVCSLQARLGKTKPQVKRLPTCDVGLSGIASNCCRNNFVGGDDPTMTLKYQFKL